MQLSPTSSTKASQFFKYGKHNLSLWSSPTHLATLLISCVWLNINTLCIQISHVKSLSIPHTIIINGTKPCYHYVPADSFRVKIFLHWECKLCKNNYPLVTFFSGDEFLNKTNKEQERTTKLDKWNYINFRSLCTAKETIKRGKRHWTEWENICKLSSWQRINIQIISAAKKQQKRLTI